MHSPSVAEEKKGSPDMAIDLSMRRSGHWPEKKVAFYSTAAATTTAAAI